MEQNMCLNQASVLLTGTAADLVAAAGSTREVSQHMIAPADIVLQACSCHHSNCFLVQSANATGQHKDTYASVQGINPSAHPQKATYYLKIYVAFSFSVMFANVLRNIAAVWGSYRASKKMHARLLDHVLLLPMAFFDSQPLGRLLNRFTKDTEAVDVELQHLVSTAHAPLHFLTTPPPPSPHTPRHTSLPCIYTVVHDLSGSKYV